MHAVLFEKYNANKTQKENKKTQTKKQQQQLKMSM